MRIYLIGSDELESLWSPVIEASGHNIVEHFLEPFDVLIADAEWLSSVLNGITERSFGFILFNSSATILGELSPDIILSGTPDMKEMLELITLCTPESLDSALTPLEVFFEDHFERSGDEYGVMGIVRLRFPRSVTHELAPPVALGGVTTIYQSLMEKVWLIPGAGRQDLSAIGPLIIKHCISNVGLTPIVGMTSLLPLPGDIPKELATQSLSAVNQALRLSKISSTESAPPSGVYFEVLEQAG